MMAAKRQSQIDNKDELMYKLVGDSTSGVSYGGYNREFITQELSEMEEILIVCPKCTGIMRDACNVGGGTAMACKTCVGEESSPQPVGKVRELILQLACICPLNHRGCEWKGVMSELSEHLDECGHLMVQCPYFKHGCNTIIERENLETHRIELKEIHTEKMSLFMAGKVDRLEEERKEEKKLLDKLELVVESLLNDRKYYKLNGIIWIIVDREAIKNKFQEFIIIDSHMKPKSPQNPDVRREASFERQPFQAPRYLPQYSPRFQIRQSCTYPRPNQPNPRPQGPGDPAIFGAVWQGTSSPENANLSQWNDNNYNGPQFTIEHNCYLFPQLSFDNNHSVCLTLVPNTIANNTWNLQGVWHVVLVNENDLQDHWSKETMVVKFSNAEKLKLMDIPAGVLLNDKFYQHGVIHMKILFRTSV